MRHRVVLSFTLASTLLCSIAGAQSGDRALAETLFDDAKRLQGQGKLDDACPKYDDSFKAYPGTGTLLASAACYEQAGKTATAWARFGEAMASARRAGQDDRAEQAEQRRAALEPKLSRIEVVVSDALRGLPGLEVKVGERVIPPSAFGLPVPVDPGNVKVVATASGKGTFEKEVVVSQAARASVKIESLPEGASSGEPAAPAAAAGPSSAPEADAGTTSASTSSSSSQRVWGFVTGGVGLLGIGAGVALNMMARSDVEAAEADCAPNSPERSCVVPTIASASDRTHYLATAQDKATASYVAFGVGGALIVTGVVLVFTAPSSESASATRLVPAVAPGFAGLNLSGNL
jgi:hypothetical protein